VLLSLIVPAYNEEERIPEMLEETLAHLSGRAASDRCV
jgi:glycosyltransferase involved in cell wall biosynthesis